MQVVAIAVGHDGLVVRAPGDEFACPTKMVDGNRVPIVPKKQADGTWKPSWYKPVQNKPEPKQSESKPNAKADGKDLA